MAEVIDIALPDQALIHPEAQPFGDSRAVWYRDGGVCAWGTPLLGCR